MIALLLTLATLAGGWWYAGRLAIRTAAFVGRQGDDVHAWLMLRDRWRSYRTQRAHAPASKGTKAIGLFLLFVVVAVLVQRPAARSVAWGGVQLSLALLWRALDVVFGRWKWALGLVAVWYFHRVRVERRRYLAGEPDDDIGEVRAACRHLVARALPLAFPPIGLAVPGTKRTPTPGPVEFARFHLPDGRGMEFGFRCELHLPAGLKPRMIRDKSSGGLDEEDDDIATAVASTIDDLMSSDEGKKIRKAIGDFPAIVSSSIDPVRADFQSKRSNRVMMTLLWRQPLRVDLAHPGPFQMESTRDLCPIGVSMSGDYVGIRKRGRHTSVQGATNSGKTSLVRSAAASWGTIHPTRHYPLAFIACDAKGEGGDMGALAPRSAFYSSNPTEIGYVLEALVAEGERRYARMQRGQGELSVFTLDEPEIICFVDEAQFVASLQPDTPHPDPRIELQWRLEAMWSIVTRMRAVGILLVVVAQLLKAKRLDSEITSQFADRVSTYQDGFDRARVAVPGSTASVGPHRIRKDMQGVAVGEFEGEGLPGELIVMRSLRVTPAQSAMWAEQQAEAGCRVELPWLAGEVQARHDRAAAAAAADAKSLAKDAAAATHGGGMASSLDEWRMKAGSKLAADQAPGDLLAAVSWLEAVQGAEPSPFAVQGYATSKQLRQWARRSSALAHRAAGATDEARDEASSMFEAVCGFTDAVRPAA